MVLTLNRLHSDEQDTLGTLYVNGKLFCFTIEDPFREQKVAGITRIPAGTYDLFLTFSPHFKRNMWEIMDVPGFTGIRIHTGNTADDTEGCILVGWGCYLGADGAKSSLDGGTSRPAYNALFTLLEKARDADEQITITINDLDR